MRRIVFDIETTSLPLESFSQSQQEYIFRDAEKETNDELRLKKREDAARCLSLYPMTAKVIAIGILDVLKQKKFVYFESNEPEDYILNEVHYKGLPECALLESFWNIIDVTDQVISFNGKTFDGPFLALRSALNGIKPSKNLNRGRYDTHFHIDLLEQFSYFGLQRKFNLDFYCHAFGIRSPKTPELNGNEISKYYELGRIKEIAAYCADDISATFQLYNIWNNFLNFSSEK